MTNVQHLKPTAAPTRESGRMPDDVDTTRLREGVVSLQAHYAAQGRVVRTGTVARQLGELLDASTPPIPEMDEPVHWAPRPWSGALHELPEGAPVTRVRSVITCPKCRMALARGGAQ